MAQLQDILFGADTALSPDEMKPRLTDLAEEIVSFLAENDAEHSQELLSGFVSDLFMSATQQTIKENRRKKQAKGIAQAKAKGVAFGRKQRPLPDNFEEARLLWRSHELSLRDAARHCGLPESTFYGAVQRAERAGMN